MEMMKKSFLSAILILVVLVCYGQKRGDQIFKYNGLYYKYIEHDFNILRVIPAPKDSTQYTGDIVVPEYVDIVDSLEEGYEGIPQQFNGVSVQYIDAKAFQNTTITSVHLHPQLMEIGSDAFKGCSNLTKAIFEDYGTLLTTVYNNEYSNPLYVAKHLYFGNSNTEVTNVIPPTDGDYYGAYVFAGGENITSVNIHQGIKRIGTKAFLGCTSITQVTLPENLETIGDYAFAGCSGINKITIPSSVTSIGSNAFNGCSGLTEVDIQGSKTILSNAFAGCTGLTKARFSTLQDLCGMSFRNGNSNPLYLAHHLYLGNNSSETLTLSLPEVTSVGKYAFAGGSELISVTIPATVTSFGEDAFAGCTKLQTADYASVDRHLDMDYGNENANPLRYAGTAKFNGETKSNITITRDHVKQYAFANCLWLNGVTITAGTIEKGAFLNCRSLTSVLLNNVTTIANDAFKSCTALKSITLPETLESIGVQAFSNCWVLEEITIPEQVTKDGLSREAFMYCYGLKTATINSTNIDKIPSKFFYGCSGLQSVQLSENVTTIDTEAFSGCSSLTALPTGGKINTIGQNAFKGCSSIQTLELPATIRQINANAFQNCTGLTQLIINQPDPAEETINIGQNVFEGCNQVDAIYSRALTAPSADQNAFGSKTDVRLYLEENATGYDKAPWSSFNLQGTMAQWTISYFIHGIEDAVHTETLITGAPITPYEYDDEKPEGWISTEWLDEIPAVMPNEDVEIHGVFTVEKKLNNNLYYRFRKDYDTKLEATVIPHQAYQDFETATVPASIEDGNKTYAVVAIADKAFEGCENLGTITIANSIKTIGQNAFANCAALTGIELPAAVTVVSDSLFYNCGNLISVTMSDNVTEIGASAFNQCNSLSDVALPSKLKTIGSLAFCKCKGLGSITIPASVTEFGNRVFLDCEELTTASFAAESPLTSLPDYTFQNCRKLVSFQLSPAMNSIKNGAFMNCTGLVILNIPEGIVSVFSNAFNGCSNLTQVIIPATLMTLGGDAFKGCTKITQVTVVAETQPDGPASVFEQKVYDEATLYVPNKNDFYKTPWTNFQNIANRTSHTLTYFVDGQQYETPLEYMTGDLIVAKAEPTKEGHGFSGWRNLPTTMPDEDCEVSGAFKYQITYQDAENDEQVYAEWLFFGDPIAAPAELEKASYTYTLSPTLEDMPTMPAANTVVTVSYLLSETIETRDGIRYYIYTQTKNNIAPHAEVMPAETGAYTNATVTMPDNIPYKEHNYPVTVIRNDAFKDCKNMTTITLSSNLQKINTQAFANCSKLTEIDIPASVETIGSEVFQRCTGLNTVTFAEQSTVNTLPTHTFMGCEALKEITLPAGLTTIANEVFRGCGALKEITLPAALTSLGDYVFLGCKKLEKIYIDSETALPTAADNTFEETAYDKVTLSVLTETVQQLVKTTSPWKEFELVDLGGETVAEKCAKPEIRYDKGTLSFTCTTPGAEIKREIIVTDAVKTEGSDDLLLNKRYVIKAYATANGYKRSDVTEATITWLDGKLCETTGFTGDVVHEEIEEGQQGVPGDMNGDGQVTAEDAALILQGLVNQDNNN